MRARRRERVRQSSTWRIRRRARLWICWALITSLTVTIAPAQLAVAWTLPLTVTQLLCVGWIVLAVTWLAWLADGGVGWLQTWPRYVDGDVHRFQPRLPFSVEVAALCGTAIGGLGQYFTNTYGYPSAAFADSRLGLTVIPIVGLGAAFLIGLCVLGITRIPGPQDG